MQKTITHLEMTHPDQLNPKYSTEENFKIQVPAIQDHRLNRFFYQWVGKDYRWTDRLSWPEEKWQAFAEQPGMQLLIASLKDTPIGFAELKKEGTEFEISIFGLADRYIGLGLGGHFLTLVIQAAWDLGASRVFLNTCDWDHPHALKNYLARGFQVYREVVV
ncbi:GNAT family N-acetyltransferase [Deinococcus roseus]|nr:GNAT family N-acetyltransferase [Deinococcus roseus]